MKGLFFKEIYLSRINLLFLLVMQVISIISIVCVELLGTHDMQAIAMIEIFSALVLYFLAYLLVDSYFLNDETKKWGIFVTATPGTYKEQLLCKYVVILIENILILYIGFIMDTVCCTIAGDSSYSASGVFFFLFCVFLLLMAFVVPFIAYFGAEHGKNVMMVFFLGIIAIILIWVMFGDISFLINNRDKGFWAILRMLQSQKVLVWAGALLPYIAVGGYYLSYRISLKLYRKGVNNDEE